LVVSPARRRDGAENRRQESHALNDIEVGALPEAVAFTPDGKYIYVGNYMDKDFSILRVDGQPGAARMSPR